MSFNNLQPSSGPFVLSPHGTMRCWVMLDNGADRGAVWIMAHPIPGTGNQPCELTVSEFTKELDYESDGGQYGPNGFEYDLDYTRPFYRYWVTVHNRSSTPVFFNLQGGGNT